MQLLFRCLFFLSYSQSVNLFFCNSVDTTIFVQQQQITQVPIDTIVRVADNVGKCAVTGLNQQASADADNSSSINHYNNTQRASPRQLNWEWEWEGRQKTEMILRRTETTKEEVSASRSVMWRKKQKNRSVCIFSNVNSSEEVRWCCCCCRTGNRRPLTFSLKKKNQICNSLAPKNAADAVASQWSAAVIVVTDDGRGYSAED